MTNTELMPLLAETSFEKLVASFKKVKLTYFLLAAISTKTFRWAQVFAYALSYNDSTFCLSNIHVLELSKCKLSHDTRGNNFLKFYFLLMQMHT